MKYLDNLINEITIKQKLEKERKKVNTNPSEKQKESGNYTKGHININGFEITIENPKGSYRKGVDSNGKEWKIKMNNDYGYFLKSIGYDGDHIDVFLGNDFDSKKIFVVDQKINGKFDESKVMFGFKTSNEAKKAYLSNYEKDWKGFHKITEVDEETFKSWLYDGKKQRKAFSEYKDMKLNETVTKIVKNLLIESQESKSQSDAIKLLQQKLGWDYEKANNFVRNDLRNDITSLRDKKIAKFTLGVTRMFIDGQLNNASVISELNTTLKLLLAHLDEYDRNLNNLSVQELISKFEQTRRDNLESERNEIDSMKFSESDYQIVPINSFEEAKKYYGYTNPNSRWCLTYMENMFDSYTSDGINQIYFCLRKGFENVKPIIGENAPLDEYGISMLSVIVNENGELAYCTTRWNHENGGSDSAMNAKQISELVGVNFYQIFKPNNKWDEMIKVVKDRLAIGTTPMQVFDKIYEFYNGVAPVSLNKKWNLINKKNEILFDRWYDEIDYFHDGFAMIKLNRRWNFINKKGELLSNQWFEAAEHFQNGFARIYSNKKWNFINKHGKILFKDGFDAILYYSPFITKVEKNEKYNLIDLKKGKILFNNWFDDIKRFHRGSENTMAYIGDKIYKLDWYGNIVNEITNDMRIAENKIKKIVNESIKRVLKEDKEQTRLTKILIKKLYNIASSYSSIYRDDDWKHFHLLIKDLKNAPGVENIDIYPEKYQRNKDGEMYKPYKLEITTEFDTMIIGKVNCYLNGSMENPYETYDMVATFYMDYNNWDI